MWGSLNPPKPDAAPGFSFGSPAGDAKPVAKPFGTPTTQATQPTFTGFGQKQATAFSLGSTPAPASTAPGLNFASGASAGFGFGTPKAATTTTSTGFSLGSTPSTGLYSGFAAPAPTSATSTSTGFSLGGTPVASSAPASAFNLGGAQTPATPAPAFNLSAAAAPKPAATLSFGTPAPTPIASVTPSLSTGTPLATTTSAGPALSFGLTGSAAKTTSSFSFGSSTTTTTTSTTGLTLGGSLGTVSTALTTSVIPTTGTLTFTQLEDAINKWTIDLEEQGKLFANQAKQLNAWDRLLISNGDKVLKLNDGIERVKQQQQQLDQELDFVLAQHKELEDLLTPLEKELHEIPVADVDRGNTYQVAENIDTQLKQMTEDLKEIIEQLNESNKTQEMSNPITQIGKILNAHMNSLQWIDHNTTKITTHLDQISKMNDLNRKSHGVNVQMSYE